jgi:hypothetical protein
MDRHVINRTDSGKRWVEVWCTRGALLDHLVGRQVASLPRDTKIISSNTDLGGTIHLLIESIEFPSVNPGDNVPQRALLTMKEKQHA